MKKTGDSEAYNALNDFPDNLVNLIKESLDTKNFNRKLKAGRTLAEMYKNILTIY